MDDSEGNGEREGRPVGWRGSGILPTGSLRIRNLSISLSGPPKPVTAEVRMDMWPRWIAVAQDSRDRAEEARAAAVAAGPNSDFIDALWAEFQASMTSLCASAFALDAFYSSTVSHAPTARIAARNRHGTIMETLKRAYALRGHREIHEGLRQVFELRRKAVHPDAEFEEFVRHPVFGLGLDPRLVWYRIENADTALLIAHRIVSFCLDNPKPQHTELVGWTKAASKLLPPLERVQPQVRRSA